MPPPPMDETSVRVAARIRPISGKEKLERCSECVKTLSKRELVMMGKDRRFTFDHVFGPESEQTDIYDECVSTLVENFLAGYNATVLAYGQTGSGKTYTMGSTSEFVQTGDLDKMGIIPRAMQQVFDLIANKKQQCPKAEFYLRVQFLELYGEDIHDLLDPTNPDKVVSIREADKADAGGIQIVGASEETVTSTEDMLETLERGTMCRTTASTEMNLHSSRSHAIFTIILEQHLPIDPLEDDEVKEAASPVKGEGDDVPGTDPSDSKLRAASTPELEYRTAKFHFVDLAGSERAKRTGAQGLRLKEGININKGLLALGNVISALGDESKRNQKFLHVPYRDSKLTRMLQDSLGGNSRTLMITCVSPADSNYEETLNALRYANRARNIKNKPVVNRDPASSQIASLKQQVAQLKAQLMQGGIIPDLSSLGKFGLSTEYGQPNMEIELNHALERASAAEDELQRISSVLEKEKRLRSELQEQYVVTVAEVEYYRTEAQHGGGEDAGQDQVEAGEVGNSKKEAGDTKEKHIQANIKYVREIQALQEQLRESDEQLAKARRQLQRVDSQILDSDEMHSFDSSSPSSSLQLMQQGEELSDKFVDSVLEAIEEDVPESQVTEQDDEHTKELKEKFHRNQEKLRESVKRYDVELKNKMMLVEKVKQEQQKYEAMKVQYEKKMMEMNVEVKDTQAQRDELDQKIRSLEKEKMTEASKTQVSKLRAQLKSKTDKLKELERRSKELDMVKRQLEKKIRARANIEREIDQIKRQKVDYQRRMEEASRKYREENKQRMNEIAQLKKQTRKDRSEKSNLEARNAKAANMLKMKTEQVAALQKRMRDQKKFAPKKNKSVMTEQEKRHRRTLEKWAQDRIQREEEFERLQRALRKKQDAVERAERVLKELEQTKKAAELRARAAEEIAVKAQLDLQNHQRGKLARSVSASAVNTSGEEPSEATAKESRSAHVERTNSDDDIHLRASTPPIVPGKKIGLRDLWMGVGALVTQGSKTGSTPEQSHCLDSNEDSKNNIPEDYLEAIEELESRLEAAESEIQFQDQQYQDAVSRFQKNKKDSPGKTGGAAKEDDIDEDDDDAKLPFQFRTLEEASAVFKQVIQMYMESKKEKLDLSAKLAQLRPQSARVSARRSVGNYRRNTILGTASSPTMRTFRGRFSGGSPRDGRLKTGRWSPGSPNGDPAYESRDLQDELTSAGREGSVGDPGKKESVLGEKLRESHEIVQELISENKKLRKLMLESGKVSSEEIDEMLAGCRVDFLEERIRQMQAIAVSASSPPGRQPRSRAIRLTSPNRRRSSPKNSGRASPRSLSPPCSSAVHGNGQQNNKTTAPVSFLVATSRKKNEVFQRLYDPKNFTGVSKRKAFDNNLVNREKTVDTMTIVPEDQHNEDGEHQRESPKGRSRRPRSESPVKSRSADATKTEVQPPSWFDVENTQSAQLPDDTSAKNASARARKVAWESQTGINENRNGTGKENEGAKGEEGTSSAFTSRMPGMVFDRLYHSKTGVQRAKAEQLAQQVGDATRTSNKESVKKPKQYLMESLALERRKRRREKVERAVNGGTTHS